MAKSSRASGPAANLVYWEKQAMQWDRSMIKVLYWDCNGFCLWMKRLEKHSFQWPSSPEEVMEIDHRQFRWLLDGLKPHQACAHDPLSYTTLI